MLCVPVVIGRDNHVVFAKILGISKFWKITIAVGTADTDFVLFKKQNLFDRNTASTGPFGAIYGSICSSRPSGQVLESIEWT